MKNTLLFLILLLSGISSAQNAPAAVNNVRKIYFNGLSADNKVSYKDFMLMDSLSLSGADSAKYKIVGGSVVILAKGEMITYSFPGHHLPNEIKNADFQKKNGKLFFEKVRAKELGTGKLIDIPDLKVIILVAP